jgi:hypothetical protein
VRIRPTRSWIGLAHKFHGCYRTSVHSEHVNHRDAIVIMLPTLRVQVNGNHNRVHASLKSSRGPRGMSVVGSP